MLCVLVLFIFIIPYSVQISPACSNNFISLGRKCYFFGNNEETWMNAHHECVEKNSSLATLINPHQHNLIKKYVNAKFSQERVERWIGGRFNEKQRIWVWGDSGKPIKYKSFGNEEINDNFKLQCLVMDQNQNNNWSIQNCLAKRRYICQTNFKNSKPRKGRRSKYDVPAPLTKITVPKNVNITKHKKNVNYACPPNMYLIGKKCYFFGDEQITWREAYYACQENNTNLAVIKNKKHDFKIREFLSDGFIEDSDRWLGGIYDYGRKKWKWPNGNTLTYTGFARIGLRNKNTRFSTIFMDRKLQYRWNIDNKMKKKGYICQTNAKEVVVVGNLTTQRKHVKKPDAVVVIKDTNVDNNTID
ncbi:unnamed protein product [Brassicogethes aeneus]|uniref:C-type lectin domain-containing protein n=1 Tax=Brassicogethes aeneus TaxID=1431903 RepID=A0A9P0ARW7_BRAAE|nr:unnamed protein product [Brassicogethes aeneus]